MVCKNCKREISPTNTFCTRCGALQTNGPVSVDIEPSRRHISYVPFLIVAVVIVIVALAGNMVRVALESVDLNERYVMGSDDDTILSFTADEYIKRFKKAAGPFNSGLVEMGLEDEYSTLFYYGEDGEVIVVVSHDDSDENMTAVSVFSETDTAIEDGSTFRSALKYAYSALGRGDHTKTEKRDIDEAIIKVTADTEEEEFLEFGDLIYYIYAYDDRVCATITTMYS